MLPKETKEMLTLPEKFDMYNFSIYEECARHRQSTNKVMANYMCEFLDDQLKISSATTTILEELLQKITDVEKFHIYGWTHDFGNYYHNRIAMLMHWG
jgi:hypothetical protein